MQFSFYWWSPSSNHLQQVVALSHIEISIVASDIIQKVMGIGRPLCDYQLQNLILVLLRLLIKMTTFSRMQTSLSISGTFAYWIIHCSFRDNT